jgi:hypothetical protein
MQITYSSLLICKCQLILGQKAMVAIDAQRDENFVEDLTVTCIHIINTDSQCLLS